MKQKIKALIGKMCWLDWKINGCPHHMAGIVKEIHEARFNFLLNSGMLAKIKFKSVTNIEEIKSC